MKRLAKTTLALSATTKQAEKVKVGPPLSRGQESEKKHKQASIISKNFSFFFVGQGCESHL